MGLKIVYQPCYSIDAHKTFVVACIASTILKLQGPSLFTPHELFEKAVTMATKGLMHGIHRKKQNSCVQCTWKFYTNILAHPKYVKAIRGKKTDKKDAKWIVDFFKHDLITRSFALL